MKLRSGKQVIKENRSLKSDSEMCSAKVLKGRQKKKVLCEVVNHIEKEPVHSSSVNEDCVVVHLADMAVSSYGTGPKTACSSQTSHKSVALTNLCGKSPSSTVTRNKYMTDIDQASLGTSFIHSGKNSKGIPVDPRSKVSPSCSTVISPFSGNSVGGTEQANSPLIVDLTKRRKGKALSKRKVSSVVCSILDKKSECVEMIHEGGNHIIKVPSVKRRRDRSVELVSRNVKAKMSDTPAVPKHTDKHPGQEDDACSDISLGCDDEVVILDGDPKPQLDCNSASDIIIDKLPSGKRVPPSDIVIIDLCTPLRKSDKSESLLNKPERVRLKDRRMKQRNGQYSANSAFKEYVPVLGNKVNSAASKPNVLSSTASHTTWEGTVPFATAAFQGSVLAPALNYCVGSIMDCGVIASSSAVGYSQVNQNSAWTASMYSSNIHCQYPNSVGVGLQQVNNQVNLASAPSSSRYGNNLYNPNPGAVRTGLRPIVIDGSNVAMGHTNGRIFSCRGLQICIDYFLKRNHRVIAFVPMFRKSSRHSQDTKILDLLEKQGLVSFTPSRMIGDRLVVPYDDRYIVQYAAECGGVIVSTDNYRDLLQENPAWRETIERRLLMFTWVGDVLMFPQDPLGRGGPSLERFLRFP